MSETYREPAWLKAAIDKRVAPFSEIPGLAHWPLVLTTLTEPDEDASEEERARWERTCDRCGKHCPNVFYTGTATRIVQGVDVIVTFGMCVQCSREATD